MSLREIVAWGFLAVFLVWMVVEAFREKPCEVCGELTRGRKCRRHRGL